MLTYILVLAAVCVMLFAAYGIAVVHENGSRLSKEKDIFTVNMERVENTIKNAGISFKVQWYFALMIAAPCIVGGVIFLLTGSIIGAVICAAVSLLLPESVIMFLKYRKDKNFERDFLRSLEQMDASLRSGSSIIHAVEDTANCKFIGASMRKRYAKLSSDMQMGISVAEAFHTFASGTDSQDMKDVAIAMELQNEVGGHEADTIRLISNNIKDRIAARKEVNSMFSSSSTMVTIIDIFVPIMIIGFTLFNEDYISTYFGNPLMALIYCALLGMSFVGTFITARMVRKVKKGE